MKFRALVVVCLVVVVAAGITDPDYLPGSSVGNPVAVKRVVDGDTLELVDGRRVRLGGIDAPERNQDHGQAATRYLKGLVDGKRVILRRTSRGVYGRVVADVLVVGDGDQLGDINGTLVRQGMAWVDPDYPRRHSRMWLVYMQRAISDRLGIWASDGDIVPPWGYRKR